MFGSFLVINPVEVIYGFVKGFKEGMKSLKEQGDGIDINPENIFSFDWYKEKILNKTNE